MSYGLGSLLLLAIAIGILYNAFVVKKNKKWSEKKRSIAFWVNIFAFIFVLIRLVWVTFFE